MWQWLRRPRKDERLAQNSLHISPSPVSQTHVNACEEVKCRSIGCLLWFGIARFSVEVTETVFLPSESEQALNNKTLRNSWLGEVTATEKELPILNRMRHRNQRRRGGKDSLILQLTAIPLPGSLCTESLGELGILIKQKL